MNLIGACERELKERMYRKVSELDITVWVTPEPVPFSKRTSGTKKHLRAGDNWGDLWDCGWFLLEGSVPPTINDEQLVLRLDISGEACVFDESGNPQKGLTNVNSRNVERLGCFGKTVYHLDRKSLEHDKVSLWVEGGCNDLFGQFCDEGRFLFADLCVENPSLRKLFYDFAVLHELMQSLDKDLPRYHSLLKVLTDVAYLLVDFSVEEVERALQILKPELLKKAGDATFGLSALGHAHIDLAWLWPIRETIRKGCRTFATVDYLMDRYPDYLFTCSQPQLYEWIKEHYPDLYERIKKRIAEGRWECQGGMWVEPDVQVPSGESLVRQLLYGKRFFREEFGKEMEVCFLPDAFGFSGALPQILQKSGARYFFTQKLTWTRTFTYPFDTFNWKGIDGSEVLSHCPPFENYSSSASPKALKSFERRFSEKRYETDCVVLFGCGDGGGGAGMEHLEALKREKNLDGLPPVKQEFLIDFYKRQDKQKGNFHTWTGPMDLDRHTGCLTSQARTKRNNRKCEQALSLVEFLLTLAHLHGRSPVSKQELDKIWKNILLYQFHDILPGSSISRVYEECDERYATMLEALKEMADNAVKAIVEDMDTSGMQMPMIAFNSLSWARNEWIETASGWRHLSLPASGYLLFDDGDRDVDDELLKKATTELFHDDSVIENAKFQVRFTPQGDIESIFDKEHGLESVSPQAPANGLRVYEDRGDAWDFPTDYRNYPSHCFALQSRETLRQGPSLVSRMVYTYGRSSLTQDVILVAGSRRLDFVTKVNWQERNKMLRTSFPVNVVMGDAHGEIQFGHVRRETHGNTIKDFTQYDVTAHRWMDISRRNYGAAVLNDCKYGYNVSNNTIDLCLLRSANHPAPDADAGSHQFTYSYFPHAGDHVTGGVIHEGYELNIPPAVYALDAKPGCQTDRMLSLFHVKDQSVIIETVKRAEDSDDIIIRLYESQGSSVTTQLVIEMPVHRVREVNLIEDLIDDVAIDGCTVALDMKPFEIKTLCLSPAL